MRINKYIALCGAASRRKADELIEAGKVKVNGQTVTQPGLDIDEANDEVTIGGRVLRPQEDRVYYMLNKPAGVISASSSDLPSSRIHCSMSSLKQNENLKSHSRIVLTVIPFIFIRISAIV